MRRMYSEQELSVIVYQVMGQYIENGAFNQTINDYIDAYLVEHPIDPTAITGLDIAPKNVTASGNITAPSIIETMSGYGYMPTTKENVNITYTYVGSVKNGNKVTFACSGYFSRSGDLAGGNCVLVRFTFPNSIGAKLYQTEIGGISGLAFGKMDFCKSYATHVDIPMVVMKESNSQIIITMYQLNDIEINTPYLFRFEITFLLSDTLI